ncbi:MAG: signal recognition particle-docking protein FtsY [Bacillota bacterium]|jgi:fused signal recognition particle receptor|nr:signal recognition particle-docking protein FtsY [Bacillota bacterium]NLM31527.1 signal recognition particle-docking protein FtsY [Acholeplasmataceae bacterium]HOA78783.1 signal recognition particle-docking protein FtsY [Bacilli bacterium]HPZ27294.1 signal recognition particle-docking protein FtsY [Bacilli bacterium]HQC89684.1 signal recognition particle-docking protein FtsY [Bacilli bacterium]
MGFMNLFRNKKKRNDKYRIGMEKTRQGAFSRLKRLFTGYNEVTEEFFDELEEIFVMADIGVDTTVKFIDELKADPRVKEIKDIKEIQPIIIDKMFDLYLKGEIVNSNLRLNKTGLSVFLFVGVNGSGKTTTIAKIANKLQKEGKRVVIAAGDTFRAGAAEQLKIWGDRVGARVVTKNQGSDPSSVIFDAIKIAKEENYDVVLCDTAGRLQTKVNLMKELAKIKRVIGREAPGAPQDTLLVIDATTGQNGLSQAKAFIEATEVTGVILTKLDGTAKGGIVLAIRDIYSLPIKFVCLGEGIEDIEYFDLEQYIYGLFAEIIEEG